MHYFLIFTKTTNLLHQKPHNPSFRPPAPVCSACFQVLGILWSCAPGHHNNRILHCRGNALFLTAWWPEILAVAVWLQSIDVSSPSELIHHFCCSWSHCLRMSWPIRSCHSCRFFQFCEHSFLCRQACQSLWREGFLESPGLSMQHLWQRGCLSCRSWIPWSLTPSEGHFKLLKKLEHDNRYHKNHYFSGPVNAMRTISLPERCRNPFHLNRGRIGYLFAVEGCNDSFSQSHVLECFQRCRDVISFCHDVELGSDFLVSRLWHLQDVRLRSIIGF